MELSASFIVAHEPPYYSIVPSLARPSNTLSSIAVSVLGIVDMNGASLSRILTGRHYCEDLCDSRLNTRVKHEM